MTQFHNDIIAFMVMVIIWHFFIKDYFYDVEELEWWLEFWRKYF